MNTHSTVVKPLKPKSLHQNTILGQLGVNLIERICLELGYLWFPTGNLETGIDGYIEIRDRMTGETTNSILQVQSRATEKEFQAETAEGFEYLCDGRDLDYWMRGNAAVILVRSRPKTNEAYWVSIKDYFSQPEKRKTRKIFFSKADHRFEVSDACAASLARLALPKDSGIYFSPLPRQEKLYSNLIEVSFPNRLYVAATDYRYYSQIWQQMEKAGVSMGSDFLLGHKTIMSFHQLDYHPWDKITQAGCTESFATSEWSDSHNGDRLRDFVQLLNRCLKEKCWQLGLKYSERCECFYFRSSTDLSPRRIKYQSFKDETSRQVFRGYFRSTDVKKEKGFYRHSAFSPQFFRHENQWYLEITPTYFFTWDGTHLDEYYEEKLKKIKLLERNLAVAGQMLMWVDYLTRKRDLFSEPYPFLIMGDHVVFDIDQGIPDEVWLPKEDDETSAALKSTEPTFFD
ncbi:MAG TPA: DUF4365 domain-containing protein [Pyrinomonadaceae bacterium]|nr:DUF4365 domain-containing protein [Pyrinomonadaceae bacterium]